MPLVNLRLLADLLTRAIISKNDSNMKFERFFTIF
jgi:hypothetical protein